MYKNLCEIIQNAEHRSQQSLEEHKAAAKMRQIPWLSVDQALPQNDSMKPAKERKYYLVKLSPSGLMTVATFGFKNHNWWVDTAGRLLAENLGLRVIGWCPLPSEMGKNVLNATDESPVC